MKKSIFTPGVSAAVGAARLPGQQSKLLVKPDRTQIDYSALSSLTRPPKPLLAPITPSGEHNYRTPIEVVEGLGLPLEIQKGLIQKLQEWKTAKNAIEVRAQLWKDLKHIAPNNYSLRTELGRRVINFYKNTIEQRSNLTDSTKIVIQKSESDLDNKLAKIRPLLILRKNPNPMDNWATAEPEVEIHSQLPADLSKKEK